MKQIEELHIPGLKIVQDKEKFCFGIDAVLLANFAEVSQTDKIIDLGTGNGIIPILMSSYTDSCNFTGLEIQEESAELAKQSVELNSLQNRIKIICGDIKNVKSLFERESFNTVITNPPYMKNDVRLNHSEAKNIARHEIFCNLTDLAQASSHLLKSGGKLFMIHRPNRLSEIFSALSKVRLEVKRMRFVHPFINSEPAMVLIEARKNAKADLRIESPLIMYESKGIYTDETKKIYQPKISK